MPLITRQSKGSKLSISEMDSNLTYLESLGLSASDQQGATGSVGPQGATGSQGFQGYIGATGPQGFQGDIGATGSVGPQGATGPFIATYNVLTATSSLSTDFIYEYTLDAGINIDGILLKDSQISGATGGVLANSMFVGFYPIGIEESITGTSSINITSYHTKFTSTSILDDLTLADGSQIGQMKKISYVAEAAGGDTGVLILTGYASITFNDVNDSCIIIWNGSAWFVLETTGNTAII